ncbi:non-ribosomal peptide synthetase [Lentzea albidocapillata]|uniref:Amino acid adenylation domain-containing protein n=1 Tax=Lentzea albidocapillata TaxID=40571 RepID=A0A1W2CW46_9PSEU|nr:non-ribosomal peptide synthetase [Lentzea albidocapillata]SMC88938.1 amino acid adenylation domain-containing protein [Lentzea albidocapillata]
MGQDDLLARIESMPPDRRHEVLARIGNGSVTAEGIAPLSFAQERMWVLTQLEPGSPAYNVPMTLAIEGDVVVADLVGAIKDVVVRHEALRTRIVSLAGSPIQVVADQHDLDVVVVDCSGAQELSTVVSAPPEPFDLAEPPLRARLVRMAAGLHVLYIDIHHIAFDDRSAELLHQDLVAFYRARRYGDSPPSPPRARYADYARLERRRAHTGRFEEGLDFWEHVLSGVSPVFDLPQEWARPRSVLAAGNSVGTILDESTLDGVDAVARSQGATSFVVLLSAWAATLSSLTNTHDVIIGTPVSNRQDSVYDDVMGLFVNTIPVPVAVDHGAGFAGLVAQVRDTLFRCLAHQDVPLDKVVDRVRPERIGKRTPLFQVMFAYSNDDPTPVRLPDVTFHPFEHVDTGAAKVDLLLFVSVAGRTLHARLEFDPTVVTAEHAGTLLDTFKVVLASGVGSSASPMRESTLVGNATEQLITELSGPARAVPPPAESLHALFERQARARPGSIAVSCGERHLTYAELDRWAGQVARRLRRAGAGPEDVVAVSLPRSVELIVGILAVLKAGSGYLPLDPRHPEDRLTSLVRRSGARLLLSDAVLAGRYTSLADVEVLDIGETDATGSEPFTSAAVHPDGLCYLMYTSGSTGQPKGVLVSHANVVRLFESTSDDMRFSPADVSTLFHSYSFDFSVWEMWSALLHGGRLVVVPDDVARSPASLVRLLREESVTALAQTPSAFASLMTEFGRSGVSAADLDLRIVVFGGEAVDLPSLAPWLSEPEQRIPRLVNMYGITETTVHTTHRVLDAGSLRGTSRSPIGRPLSDVSVHVLDPEGRHVPIGIVGEIHVGGAGVARCYHDQPGLTASRFVPDPFGTVPGARLYRSGDLARWTGEHELEFVGRNDDQVKIRGHRVELGEVKNAVDRIAAVTQSYVDFNDGLGEGQISAYVVVREQVTAGNLRAELSRLVPEYLVPARIILVPALPLTANGKVDSKLLAEITARPDVSARTPDDRDLTEGQRVVLDVLRAVLDSPDAGPHEDFFELGGHSLAAVRFAHELESRLGTPRRVDPVLVLQERTAARIAVAVTRDAAGPDWATLRAAAGDLPLLLLPGSGGNLFSYQDVTRALTNETSVYGLSHHPPADVRDGISGLAKHCATALGDWPDEPYLLGGWSLGGLVAAETVRVLHENGRAPAGLVLLDPASPDDIAQEASTDRMAAFIEDLEASAQCPLEIAPRTLDGLTETEALSVVADHVARTSLADRYRGADDVPEAFYRFTSSIDAIHSHTMAGTITVPTALFAPAAGAPNTLWQNICADLMFVPVEGDHYSMLREPFAGDLAGALQRFIGAVALRQRPASDS